MLINALNGFIFSFGPSFSPSSSFTAILSRCPTETTAAYTSGTWLPITTIYCPPFWITVTIPSVSFRISVCAFDSSFNLNRSLVTQWVRPAMFPLPPTFWIIILANPSYLLAIVIPPFSRDVLSGIRLLKKPGTISTQFHIPICNHVSSSGFCQPNVTIP